MSWINVKKGIVVAMKTRNDKICSGRADLEKFGDGKSSFSIDMI